MEVARKRRWKKLVCVRHFSPAEKKTYDEMGPDKTMIANIIIVCANIKGYVLQRYETFLPILENAAMLCCATFEMSTLTNV